MSTQRTSTTLRDRGGIRTPVTRPTSWWLEKLRHRAATMYKEPMDWSQRVTFSSPREQAACIAFFNAAFRAEESGLSQAHRLAEQIRPLDADLAECLVLYGNEEGWHRELLEGFFQAIGGTVRPMGRVTRAFYNSYAEARDMETIMLTNLMFETIGSTTYRLALGRVEHPSVRAMLTILTRDESFHVPLNVHFIREAARLQGGLPFLKKMKLRAVYHGLFAALIGSAAASREVASAFDHITFRELAGAYVENLSQLFVNDPEFNFRPNGLILRAFGLNRHKIEQDAPQGVTSIAAAEASAERERVQVVAL